MTKLDQTKINDIIKTFIQETLDFDEEVRTNRKGPFSLEEIDQRADFIGSLRAEKQEDLAKCDYRSAASAVNIGAIIKVSIRNKKIYRSDAKWK